MPTKNLEELAELFTLHAWQSTAFADRLHKTQRAKLLAERERATWLRAAAIVRDATLEEFKP